MQLLNNKTVVVTGAGSGIGREVSLLFAERGADLILMGLTKSKLEDVRKEIEIIGGQAIAIETDVSDEGSVVRSFSAISLSFERLDVLVNVAGIFESGNILDTSIEQWNKLIGVNLNGVFLCMRSAIPLMRGTGGSIVNVSSEAGLVGIPNQIAYNVSKAGVIALTKSAAVDYAKDNIRVNCVCPGRILTPLVQDIIDNSEDPNGTFEALSHDRPLMRMGNPREIAMACLMLARDDLSYATGSVLSVDGGYTAR